MSNKTSILDNAKPVYKDKMTTQTPTQKLKRKIIRIVKINKNRTICKICKDIIDYKAWGWENHMDEKHPKVDWRSADTSFLSEKCFRDLTQEEVIELIIKQIKRLK